MLMSSALAVVAFSALTQGPQPPAPATQPPPKPFDCSAPEYRQFDFWVGDWDVVPNPATRPANASPPPGTPIPRNVVQKAHNGCVIVENWDPGNGNTGQSLNLFDRVSRRWHQTWVDSGGGLHQYWGELKDGSMVLQGDVPLGPAVRFQGHRTIRVTFTPMGPDTMRQFSESLNSDGTWTVSYDFIYTRRPGTK
jgi:hypothetical protein